MVAVRSILVLCTGNSARSILAEAAINHLPTLRERFVGHSAGSQPRGEVNPYALELLQRAGIDTQSLRSKSWDEFAAPGAPHMDLVITVCDNAAGEVCPFWPGQPATAHWGYADPSEVQGSDDERREAFRRTLHLIGRRLELLVSLPASALDRLGLQDQARRLAKEAPEGGA